MKLIDENSGRTIISFQSTSMGVGASQQVLPTGNLKLDTTSAVTSGLDAPGTGQGIYVGADASGTPVMQVGSDSAGIYWDGETLTVIGNVVLGIGNSISGGETAFATGVGFWIGTDASGNPQFSLIDKFNNYILFDGSTSNPIAISSTGVINVLSSKQTDDAAWSKTAVFGGVGSTPTTRAGYGITDAQGTLPVATATRQALFRDLGGSPYFSNLYDTNVNQGAITLTNDSPAVNISPGKVWGGQTIGIVNPGQPVNIHATLTGDVNFNATAVTGSAIVQYSIDGGSTWTGGQRIAGTCDATNTSIPLVGEVWAFGVVPTGDVLARVLIGAVSGSNAWNANNGTLSIELFPQSAFYQLSALAASIPATATMSCSAVFPLTTCTASTAVTVANLTGVSPFSFSWSVVSGTGTITSGSTAQTCTVSDTETTAEPAATSNTTVKCLVTDSQAYVTTAGSQSGGTATVTIGSHFIASGNKVTVSGCTPSAYNGTFTITGVTATQIKYAVVGSPGAITVQGTVNGVNTTTGNCVITGSFLRTFAPITGSVIIHDAAAKIGTHGQCGLVITGNQGTATAVPSGGNGSYTYSWSVTSFTGSNGFIVSGGSTSVATVGADGVATNPATDYTVTVQCAVNDSRGTGSINIGGTMNFPIGCL